MNSLWSYNLEEYIYQMHGYNVFTQDTKPTQTTKDLQNGQEPNF